MPRIQSLSLKRLWHYAAYQSITLPLVLLLFIIMVLITPVGDFPLNDDWIYAKTVQHLLQTGQYQAHPYLNATLVVQAYWGALFCKLFGFSFTTLRISTLLLSGLNAWGIAHCGLTLGFPRPLALLCGIVVMTNPLMLGLSYSFMTDIPFLALSTLSGLCFLRAFRRLSTALIVWGSVLGMAAFFVRQFGVLVPIAFALTLAMLQVRGQVAVRAATWLALVLPWAIATLLYISFAPMIQSDTPILELVSQHHWIVIMNGIRYLPVSLSYMGLFLLPLGGALLWPLRQNVKPWNRQDWLIFSGFCSASMILFFLPQILYWLVQHFSTKEVLWLHQYPYRMPLLNFGMLLDFGLGHVQLPNLIPQPSIQIHEGWWVVTFPALAIGGLLFTSAWKQMRVWFGKVHTLNSRPLQFQILFLWVWGGVALLSPYNPWRAIITDRYLLMAFAPFTLILAMELRRASSTVAKYAAVSTVLGLIISLMLLQDYMAWNRTASFAQHQLMTKDGISAGAIAGTDPMNGWYNSDTYMKRFHTRSWWDLNIGGKGSWVLDNQYVIASTEPRPGYEVLEKFPYFSWLGWQERTIIIFKRLSAEAKN